MEAKEIARERMHSHRLWGPSYPDAGEVVRAFGAMQAQEYLPAKWAIAQRAGDLSDAQVEAAVADGTILRTHILRPTWHFVHRDDLRWMMRLSAPRVNALNAYINRREGLDEEVFRRTNALLAKTLKGGRQLTRKELAPLFPEAKGLALAYIMMRAELDLVICSGARKGKQQTYALFDDRVPAGEPWDREKALAELARRYFTTRGPATTVKDFTTWSSLTAADGRLGWEMVRNELPSFEAPAVKGVRVDLLQGYDEYVMSYSDSREVIRLEGVTPQPAQHLHAIMRNGQVIGHWKPVPKKGIELQLFRSLSAAETKALDKARERFLAFSG